MGNNNKQQQQSSPTPHTQTSTEIKTEIITTASTGITMDTISTFSMQNRSARIPTIAATKTATLLMKTMSAPIKIITAITITEAQAISLVMTGKTTRTTK